MLLSPWCHLIYWSYTNWHAERKYIWSLVAQELLSLSHHNGLWDAVTTFPVTACFQHPLQTGFFLISMASREWTSYQIRKIAGCACARNAGNVFPRRRFQSKPLVSDPGMHHGTCVTHVPWCMSGSLTCGDGENVPGIPGACAPAMLRIWQKAHG